MSISNPGDFDSGQNPEPSKNLSRQEIEQMFILEASEYLPKIRPAIRLNTDETHFFQAFDDGEYIVRAYYDFDRKNGFFPLGRANFLRKGAEFTPTSVRKNGEGESTTIEFLSTSPKSHNLKDYGVESGILAELHSFTGLWFVQVVYDQNGNLNQVKDLLPKTLNRDTLLAEGEDLELSRQILDHLSDDETKYLNLGEVEFKVSKQFDEERGQQFVVVKKRFEGIVVNYKIPTKIDTEEEVKERLLGNFNNEDPFVMGIHEDKWMHMDLREALNGLSWGAVNEEVLGLSKLLGNKKDLDF